MHIQARATDFSESTENARKADGRQRKLQGWKIVAVVSSANCGHSTGVIPHDPCVFEINDRFKPCRPDDLVTSNETIH